MRVGELLQYELWSKETSRKIFVGLGVLVVGLVSWHLLDLHWISPGERSAARVALAQIDALQNLDSISDEDFNARDKQAELKVETAKQAARTTRDKRVAEALYGYLVGTESERIAFQDRELMQQRHISLSNSDRQFEEKLDSSGKEATQFVRSVLHRALD